MSSIVEDIDVDIENLRIMKTYLLKAKKETGHVIEMEKLKTSSTPVSDLQMAGLYDLTPPCSLFLQGKDKIREVREKILSLKSKAHTCFYRGYVFFQYRFCDFYCITDDLEIFKIAIGFDVLTDGFLSALTKRNYTIDRSTSPETLIVGIQDIISPLRNRGGLNWYQRDESGKENGRLYRLDDFELEAVDYEARRKTVDPCKCKTDHHCPAVGINFKPLFYETISESCLDTFSSHALSLDKEGRILFITSQDKLVVYSPDFQKLASFSLIEEILYCSRFFDYRGDFYLRGYSLKLGSDLCVYLRISIPPVRDNRSYKEEEELHLSSFFRLQLKIK